MLKVKQLNKMLMFVSVLALSLPINAVAVQLGIGGIMIGTPLDDSVNSKRKNCSIAGMILKTIRCNLMLVLDGILLDVETSYDLNDKMLVRLYSEFDSSLFDKVKTALDSIYGQYVNEVVTLFFKPSSITYETEIDNITLKFNGTKAKSSVEVLSNSWKQKYETLLNDSVFNK